MVLNGLLSEVFLRWRVIGGGGQICCALSGGLCCVARFHVLR